MVVAERNPLSVTTEHRREKQEIRIVDLGFVRWETSWSRPSLSNGYFEVFLARPRGSDGAFSFLLKALRPQYCGSPLGTAIIERERCLGALDCRRTLPCVDYAYPKRVSATRATRGFTVCPYYRGRVLAKLLKKNRHIDADAIIATRRALREVADALKKRSWALERILPEQVLVMDDCGNGNNAMLVDYSTAFRFADISLFTETFACKSFQDVSFDPERLLAPNAFYRNDLDHLSTERAVERFFQSIS